MSHFSNRFFVLLIAALLLTGCAAPVPTATPTVTPFPPTSTATPTQTAAPTLTPAPSFTPTPSWVAQGPGIVECPILLYHHIAESETGSRYYVSPENFEAQMRALRDWGYTSIPLSLLVAAITEGADLPPRPVIITFDDGDVSVYDNAFPIMQRYGFTGVLYIVSNRLEADGFMNVEQIKEMTAAGWEVGSHSMSHADLTKRDNDGLYAEVVQSRKDLEAALGVPVASFAYPFGKLSDAAVDYVHFIKYEAAVGLGYTAEQGKGNLFYLQRRPVGWEYDLTRFAAVLPWTGPVDVTETPTQPTQ
ncbi:MAG: polysaccharide deacetylase family protein [Chloroflexi bacterium]|nr:polysaccharide deacetylase family protein [Chloroflexota bacterium]